MKTKKVALSSLFFAHAPRKLGKSLLFRNFLRIDEWVRLTLRHVGHFFLARKQRSVTRILSFAVPSVAEGNSRYAANPRQLSSTERA